MSSYTHRRSAGLCAPIILAGIALGCAKEPERSTRLETASTPPAAAVDTASAKADTVAAKPSTDSARATPAPAQSDTVVKPVRARAAAKPSQAAITRSATDTAPRGAPVADSAASTSQPPAAAPSGPESEYLKYDAASNTVTFELIAGPRGFQFNGYASGGATLAVPSKANMVINFINKDGTPHSAVVIAGEGPLPNAATDPAIPRAYTNKLLEGLPQEGTDVLRFQVPETGKYRIFCGVPGHGLSGMWIWMVVDPAAKAPSFGPTKA
jgi:Sulfocyanin (SoxE) domain